MAGERLLENFNADRQRKVSCLCVSAGHDLLDYRIGQRALEPDGGALRHGTGGVTKPGVGVFEDSEQ